MQNVHRILVEQACKYLIFLARCAISISKRSGYYRKKKGPGWGELAAAEDCPAFAGRGSFYLKEKLGSSFDLSRCCFQYIQGWAVILMGWTFFQSSVGHTKIPRNFRTGIARFTNNGFVAILRRKTRVGINPNVVALSTCC